MINTMTHRPLYNMDTSLVPKNPKKTLGKKKQGKKALTLSLGMTLYPVLWYMHT